MRRPSLPLVVDASILIAIIRGRGSAALHAAVTRHRLVATERAIEEAGRRIELGMKAPHLIPALHEFAALLTIVPHGGLDVATAEVALRDAVASRNGSVADAHVLACAWAYEADIWSFDRDFAGAGVASWSTVNLMRALPEEAA